MKHLYEYSFDPLTGKKSMSFFLTFGEKKFISKYSKNLSLSTNKDTEICLVTKKKTGKHYICKIVDSKKLRINEFIIPNTINSPRVTKINEIYQTSIKGEDKTFMMMEYTKDTIDIFDYIIEKNLISEKSIVEIIYYSALALKDVHDKGYYHGHVQGQNGCDRYLCTGGENEQCDCPADSAREHHDPDRIEPVQKIARKRHD